MRTPVIAAAALLIGAISIVPQVEARRVGGVHVHARPHVARVHNIHPGVRVAAHHNYRYHRRGRWVNGVWVASGVAASVAAGTASNCGYYYRKWKETAKIYWRDRYYEACR